MNHELPTTINKIRGFSVKWCRPESVVCVRGGADASLTKRGKSGGTGKPYYLLKLVKVTTGGAGSGL